MTPSRQLDEAAVQRILQRHASKQASNKRGTEGAISKDLRTRIAHVVEKGNKSFSYGGQAFSVRYEGEAVYVKPVDGFVPCGWFNRAQLRTMLTTENL